MVINLWLLVFWSSCCASSFLIVVERTRPTTHGRDTAYKSNIVPSRPSSSSSSSSSSHSPWWWWILQNSPSANQGNTNTTTTTNNNDNNIPPKSKGYQFGDITKSIWSQGVNSLTGGNEEYEFGDVSRWLVGQVSSRVANYTGKESYQVGDLTRTWIANYTGKSDYEFGDLSRSILQRVQSGEYQVGDVFFALRILLSAGLTIFTPVTMALPLRLLLQLMNLGLAEEITGRLTTVLAQFLDQRMKQALTGNAQYQMGDFIKKRLQQELTQFTGKDSYQVGDITRTIQQQLKQQQQPSSSPLQSSKAKNSFLLLPSEVIQALEVFDQQISLQNNKKGK